MRSEKELNALQEKYSRLLSEKLQLQYELEELRSSVDKIKKQDDEIRVLHENIRRTKHNMQNHLMVIASYLNDGDNNSAKEYTSEILDKLNSAPGFIETGNSLLNHIINAKLNKARKMGIGVKAEIENLAFAKMEGLDFSALLSNIIDNAIEASIRESAPEINVVISARRGYETILVKNKIEESVLSYNPNLTTTKKAPQHHGIRVPQIKSICDKYSGLCDFYEEDGFFCVSAFIPV